jgi:site-specific DNA recombinase
MRGRNARYRYYTCYSRSRYGAAGCTGVRLAVDATDTAVLQALHDFYQQTSILEQVIATARQEFRDTHTDRRAELDAITAQISHTQTAIDRYHTAFENGTMDDATAGPRITELRHKITQLTARRDDLTSGLDAEPAPPPPGTIEQLRAYLHHAVTAGTSGERKRAIEALVAEIRITQEGRVIPMFRIPTRRHEIHIPEFTASTTAPGSRNGEVGGPTGTRTGPHAPPMAHPAKDLGPTRGSHASRTTTVAKTAPP